MVNNIKYIFICLLLCSCNLKYEQTMGTVSSKDETVPIQKHSTLQSTIIGIPTEEYSLNIGNEKCVGTFEDFSFSLIDENGNRGMAPIYPMKPWNKVFEFQPDGYEYSLIGISINKGIAEIWVLGVYQEGDQKKYKYLIYDTEEGVITEISSYVGTINNLVGNFIFLNDGTIIGRNFPNQIDVDKIQSIPLLSIYDRKNMEFQVDEKSIKITQGQDESHQIGKGVLIKEGANGIVWFAIPYDGIYSYNSDSGENIKHVDIPDDSYVDELTISSDGNIYYLLWPDLPVIMDGFRNVYQYSIETGIQSIFAKVETLSLGSGSLMMDHNNNLWLGVISAIDIRGVQTIFHPEYDEYKEVINKSGSEDYFSNTRLVAESSNNRLWFTKNYSTKNGTAWLDTNTNEGCWFTTFSGNVFEDNNQQMWFLAGNKLYNFSLEN